MIQIIRIIKSCQFNSHDRGGNLDTTLILWIITIKWILISHFFYRQWNLLKSPTRTTKSQSKYNYNIGNSLSVTFFVINPAINLLQLSVFLYCSSILSDPCNFFFFHILQYLCQVFYPRSSNAISNITVNYCLL